MVVASSLHVTHRSIEAWKTQIYDCAAQHTQGKAERKLCGSHSRWGFVTFFLQTSTIFQGRCKLGIVAVELTDYFFF